MFFLSRYFRRLEFTGRGGYGELIALAYPLILLCASNTIMQFVDRQFLSSLSTVDVAAAMPSGILYFSLFCIFLCTVGFTSAIVAQYHGANDKTGVLRSVWSGVYFSLGAALFIVTVLPFAGKAVIEFFNHSPELMVRELDYFYGLVPSGAFACLSSPFFAFFSGQGRTKPVAAINIFGCMANIGLDYIFIFGWGDVIPAWGIWGAGIATSIGAMLSMLIVVVYFLCQDQRVYPTRSARQPDWSCVKRLVRYGAPSGLQTALDCGAFTLVTFTVGYLGELQLAAHTIALSINNMFFIPLLGLSDATSILIGQYIGRAKHAIAGRIAFRAWRMGALYMCLGGIVYWLFPRALAEMFGSPDNRAEFAPVVETVRYLLLVAFCFNFCDTLKFIFTASLRGAGDTRPVMIICMSCAYLLMVPGTLLLVLYFRAPVTMVWGFLVCCALLEGVLILRRFRTGRWRKIRLIEAPDKIARLDEKSSPEPAR